MGNPPSQDMPTKSKAFMRSPAPPHFSAASRGRYQPLRPPASASHISGPRNAGSGK